MKPPLNDRLWNDYLGKKMLLAAMVLTLLTHGVIFYYTLPGTYDAYVHIFFADHYSRFWFEPWDHRWYTGFLTISYPPLLHQMTALLAKLFPYKAAFAIYSVFIFEVLVIGVYRFTKLFFNKPVAGVAALLTVVMSSMIETLHVFGQIPTLHGISFLLNALPFLYQYIVKRKLFYLIMALAFLSVVISAHHVTAIFGQVFFIAPTVFMALYDRMPLYKKLRNLFSQGWSVVVEAFKSYRQLIFFGTVFGILAISLIFPYWYWSKTDPINQVSIPHGSRDNFFEKTSSGLVFFIIPLAAVISYFPAIAHAITKQKRLIGWAVSFFLCFLLGSGGTTPIPKKMLGEKAFNILTLDRFGFWASVIAIPFIAKFIYSFLSGPVRDFWIRRFKAPAHFLVSGLLGFAYFLFIIFVFHLGSFRPLQPKEINMQPLTNFLSRDDHMRWRFLTLGFGDQMAWLSTNTLAASVDGNYHSARRLPELTTRPVERLENAKYNGEDGLESLRDFLVSADKYSLKYVFSNDRYYDPLLFFTGWNRVIQLENGIMVWEKGNIPTIKPVTPKKVSPLLKLAWGILPLSVLGITALLSVFYLLKFKQKEYFERIPETKLDYPRRIIYASVLLPILFFSAIMLIQVRELLFLKEQKDPETTVLSYYNHLDFQRFETAFGFFKPGYTYTLDQYLLEKSVNEGGLLPSYAKLDSIRVTPLLQTKSQARVRVYTRWRTSLRLWEQEDTLQLEKIDKAWFILPPRTRIDMDSLQVRNHDYLLFKKAGKRLISSFPTVKDDRIKKPFASVLQAGLLSDKGRHYITGEVLNADDIPVNLALKAIVYYDSNRTATFYPDYNFQYNLSPKASTCFQIELDSAARMDALGIRSIELRVETDVSERGYIHGGTLAFSVEQEKSDTATIHVSMYNELTTEINIPAVLIAEKDKEGRIWQVDFGLSTKSVRSGLVRTFDLPFTPVRHRAKRLDQYPLRVFVNGQRRSSSFKVTPDRAANGNQGISLISHSFIANEIYLQ